MRKVFPWLTNVSLYGCLFAGGDLLHQRVAHKDGGEVDWKRTRNVALVAFGFHGNWNYFWLRALERRFPGRSLGTVLTKLALDQSLASPLATSVFYTGKSKEMSRAKKIRIKKNKEIIKITRFKNSDLNL